MIVPTPQRLLLLKFTYPLLCGVILMPLVMGCSSDTPAPALQQTPHSFAWHLDQIQSGASDTLSIDAFAVNDEELASAGKIPGLHVIRLDAGVITDAGIRGLADADALRELRLRLSPLSDASIDVLAALPQLRILNLPHSELTADGIAQLAAAEKLRSLRLGTIDKNSPVGSAVSQLTQLTHVHLIDIPLSEEELLSLASMPNLQSLYIDGAGAPDAAWDRVFEAYPQLHIHIDQAHHDRDPNRHD